MHRGGDRLWPRLVEKLESIQQLVVMKTKKCEQRKWIGCDRPLTHHNDYYYYYHPTTSTTHSWTCWLWQRWTVSIVGRIAYISLRHDFWAESKRNVSSEVVSAGSKHENLGGRVATPCTLLSDIYLVLMIIIRLATSHNALTLLIEYQSFSWKKKSPDRKEIYAHIQQQVVKRYHVVYIYQAPLTRTYLLVDYFITLSLYVSTFVY